jgi:hypothetical protein
MQYTLQNLKAIWTNVLEEKDFARRFYINFTFCFVTYIAFAQLVAMNKDRPGVVLNDVIQNMLPPHNFSPLYLSCLTYSGIVIFLAPFYLSIQNCSIAPFRALPPFSLHEQFLSF